MSHHEEFSIENILEDYKDNPLGFSRRLIELELIPFDITDSIIDDLFQYGFLGVGGLIGKEVLVTRIQTFEISGITYDFNNWPGIIVGDLFGRYIISIENFYYGWVDSTTFKFMDNYHSTDYQIH